MPRASAARARRELEGVEAGLGRAELGVPLHRAVRLRIQSGPPDRQMPSSRSSSASASPSGGQTTGMPPTTSIARR